MALVYKEQSNQFNGLIIEDVNDELILVGKDSALIQAFLKTVFAY